MIEHALVDVVTETSDELIQMRRNACKEGRVGEPLQIGELFGGTDLSSAVMIYCDWMASFNSDIYQLRHLYQHF